VTEVRYPDITVQLTGTDGNGFAVLGRERRALREAGVDEEEVSQFTAEATSGDYASCSRRLRAGSTSRKSTRPFRTTLPRDARATRSLVTRSARTAA